jgi:hypothetical protein
VPYREKVGLHLKACFGETFAEGSYWYEHPDENKFFAQVFRMAIAAGGAAGSVATAGSEEDVAKVFKKSGNHVTVHEPSLKRLGCTKVGGCTAVEFILLTLVAGSAAWSQHLKCLVSTLGT